MKVLPINEWVSISPWDREMIAGRKGVKEM